MKKQILAPESDSGALPLSTPPAALLTADTKRM